MRNRDASVRISHQPSSFFARLSEQARIGNALGKQISLTEKNGSWSI
jgi:hypothetical protein